MRYFQRFDGEGFAVKSNQKTRWGCCECGLVHDIVFVSNDGEPIGVAARVNTRATAAKRRQRALRRQADKKSASYGEDRSED